MTLKRGLLSLALITTAAWGGARPAAADEIWFSQARSSAAPGSAAATTKPVRFHSQRAELLVRDGASLVLRSPWFQDGDAEDQHVAHMKFGSPREAQTALDLVQQLAKRGVVNLELPGQTGQWDGRREPHYDLSKPGARAIRVVTAGQRSAEYEGQRAYSEGALDRGYDTSGVVDAPSRAVSLLALVKRGLRMGYGANPATDGKKLASLVARVPADAVVRTPMEHMLRQEGHASVATPAGSAKAMVAARAVRSAR